MVNEMKPKGNVTPEGALLGDGFATTARFASVVPGGEATTTRLKLRSVYTGNKDSLAAIFKPVFVAKSPLREPNRMIGKLVPGLGVKPFTRLTSSVPPRFAMECRMS